MKKLLFVVLLAVASITVYAQPRAIGARLGGFDGISYQHSFGESNMLEVEAGWGLGGCMSVNGGTFFPGRYGLLSHSVQVAITYDWIDPFGAAVPWNEKGEWHWYMGVGGAGGYLFDNAGFVGAAGRIGIEYDFWFPLQLAIDYRPVVGAYLSDNGAGGVASGCYWDLWTAALGFSIRYKF